MEIELSSKDSDLDLCEENERLKKENEKLLNFIKTLPLEDPDYYADLFLQEHKLGRHVNYEHLSGN